MLSRLWEDKALDNRDNELRLEVHTKPERAVMNNDGVPEFVNLSTHFSPDIEAEQSLGYESLQFTESSSAFIDSYEDEELLSGMVVPKVVKREEPEISADAMPVSTSNGDEANIATEASTNIATPDNDEQLMNARVRYETMNSSEKDAFEIGYDAAMRISRLQDEQLKQNAALGGSVNVSSNASYTKPPYSDFDPLEDLRASNEPKPSVHPMNNPAILWAIVIALIVVVVLEVLGLIYVF